MLECRWLIASFGRWYLPEKTVELGENQHYQTWAKEDRLIVPEGDMIDFGRILWGQANEYPQEILLHDDGRPAGLFHLRIT